MSSIEVVEMDPVEIRGADYNPRRRLKRGQKDYEALKSSLLEFGLVEPLVWNQRSEKQGWPKGEEGVLVGGHQRLTVIQELGWPTVPVSVVDLDADREKALNVLLNKVEGSWKNDTLAQVLADLEKSDVPVELTGFSGSELDKLLADAEYHDPEIEWTEELLEEHNYVVLYFDNTVDWESAREVFGLKTVKALDSKKGYERKGIGRVVNGAPVVKQLLGS